MNARGRVLVTGANGFVGQAVCRLAMAKGYEVTAAVRDASRAPAEPKIRCVAVGDIGPTTDWTDALAGVSCVIHTAGRAHVMRDRAHDPLREFRRVNTLGTIRLAECAARSSAGRLVFVSSVKVNGERSTCADGLREIDEPCPQDPYGVSKWEAEKALLALDAFRALDVAVVRPPLVYGPGVRANFLSLMAWVDRGVPLPLGAVRNRRSLVSVYNLAELLLACAHHPAASGEVFFACDESPVSTPELVRLLANALGRPARLLAIPTPMLKVAGALSGKSNQIRRLCDSLVVTGTKSRDRLGWRPAMTLEEGLRLTAEWYRSIGQSRLRSARGFETA